MEPSKIYTFKMKDNENELKYTIYLYKSNIKNVKDFINIYIHNFLKLDSNDDPTKFVSNMANMIKDDIYENFLLTNNIYEYLSKEINKCILNLKIKNYVSFNKDILCKETNLFNQQSNNFHIAFTCNQKFFILIMTYTCNNYLDKQINTQTTQITDLINKINSSDFFKLLEETKNKYNNILINNNTKLNNMRKYKNECKELLTKTIYVINIQLKDNMNLIENNRKLLLETSVDDHEKINTLDTLFKHYEKICYEIIQKYDYNIISNYSNLYCDLMYLDVYQEYESNIYNKQFVLHWIQNKQDLIENLQKKILIGDNELEQLETEIEQLNKTIKKCET